MTHRRTRVVGDCGCAVTRPSVVCSLSEWTCGGGSDRWVASCTAGLARQRAHMVDSRHRPACPNLIPLLIPLPRNPRARAATLRAFPRAAYPWA
eukprot:366566-Chlamydomonas_euryale.AAC.7